MQLGDSAEKAMQSSVVDVVVELKHLRWRKVAGQDGYVDASLGCRTRRSLAGADSDSESAAAVLEFARMPLGLEYWRDAMLTVVNPWWTEWWRFGENWSGSCWKASCCSSDRPREEELREEW